MNYAPRNISLVSISLNVFSADLRKLHHLIHFSDQRQATYSASATMCPSVLRSTQSVPVVGRVATAAAAAAASAGCQMSPRSSCRAAPRCADPHANEMDKRFQLAVCHPPTHSAMFNSQTAVYYCSRRFVCVVAASGVNTVIRCLSV